MVNLGLGIGNLIPIPGTDGWRLLDLVMEGAGHPIPLSVRRSVAVIAYAALIVWALTR